MTQIFISNSNVFFEYCTFLEYDLAIGLIEFNARIFEDIMIYLVWGDWNELKINE